MRLIHFLESAYHPYQFQCLLLEFHLPQYTQYNLTQVQQARNASGAKNVSAVVLEAKTGEVLAMANDNTFDPSQDIGRQSDRQIGNLAVIQRGYTLNGRLLRAARVIVARTPG